MGSLEEAICTGFICRLCSRLNRSVVFIFGMKGIELDLLNKINSYLPIKVSEEDELPKTICEACLQKILQHHHLIERIKLVQQRFNQMREEDMITQPTSAEPMAEVGLPPLESTRSSRTLSVDSNEPPAPVSVPEAAAGAVQAASPDSAPPTDPAPSHEPPTVSQSHEPIPCSSNAHQARHTRKKSRAAIMRRLRSQQRRERIAGSASSLSDSNSSKHAGPSALVRTSSRLKQVRKRQVPRPRKVVKKRTK